MSENQSQPECLEFERARYHYCAGLYEREAQIKDNLEKKSQFLLSFITLLLSALFLKLDFFDGLGELLAQAPAPAPLRAAIYGSMVVLGSSLLFSLMAVMASMWLQRYKKEHPRNLVSSLFAPDSDYLEKTEAGLFRSTATGYAVALEYNSRVNARKAEWVTRASAGVLVSVVSLAVLLALVLFLKVR